MPSEFRDNVNSISSFKRRKSQRILRIRNNIKENGDLKMIGRSYYDVADSTRFDDNVRVRSRQQEIDITQDETVTKQQFKNCEGSL